MTPERVIQNQLCSWLTAKGAFIFIHDSVGIYDPIKRVYRSNRSPYRRKGVADILGIFRGYPLAVEVKTPTGRVSPEQKAFIAQWREAGGIGLVARGIDEMQTEITRQYMALEDARRPER